MRKRHTRGRRKESKIKAPGDLPDYLHKILDHPVTLDEIKDKFNPARAREVVRELKAYVKTGQVVKIRGGRYGLAEKMNLVSGTVHGHPDGFGFVLPEDPEKKDVYIGPRNFHKAMHGDRVICRIEGANREGKLEGSVIRILERAHTAVTGVFLSRGRGGVVAPTHKRIVQDFLIPPEMTERAKSGQVVTAKITEYPDVHRPGQAEVIDVLGFPDDPQVEKTVIIRQYDLPEQFEEKVEAQAQRIRPPADKDFRGRLDLRNDWVVTIDGETAKDFDDAVSIKETAKGFELGVHIADVSNYVKPGTILDSAAYERATSTYFPGSVIPMLPFNLSDDICSLKPNVDRLTLSAIIQFNRAGIATSCRFAPSVINSKHRLTYTEAHRIMERPDEEPDREKARKLSLMKTLCAEINRQRMAEGSIDFDLPEPEILLDMRGEPENIIRAERNSAHRLIEEFMLSANRQAALFLSDRPAVYRIHPEPTAEKLEEFFDFAQRLGHPPPRATSVSRKLQEILEHAAGKPEEKLMNLLMLRSMKKASYATGNVGHFGLAFSHYTHFTSPIRRYPDLMVHRAIKEKLDGAQVCDNTADLATAAAHCSHREQVSEMAERDVIDALKVRFIADHEGETFDGVISGVTSFGLFVELNEIFVEGLLRMTDLHDDYYEYHEKEYAIIGKRKRKTFTLGSPVRVRIKSVDLAKKEITMEPADARRGTSPKKEGRGKKFKGGRRRRKG